MKTRHCLIVLSVLAQMILLPGFSSSGATGTDEAVLKAYHLRMDGKGDQAKALLESLIAKDSNDAMAYYELARLKQYMLIGGGSVKVEEVISSIDKAVKLDPENVIFSYYRAITCFFHAFMAMQGQQQDQVQPRISETCKAFDKVLALKPDYHEAMLYLVEIYGLLPRDMGGDSIKAVIYAEKLGKMDPYFGAKAKAVLLPENADRSKYWEGFLARDRKNPELLMESGIACLTKDDPAGAERYFEDAITADPAKNYLTLDLARYHIYKAMQNRELAKTELPVAEKYLKKYLKSVPEPVVPLKAYTNGLLATIAMFLGDKAGGEKIINETKLMDPYFSRASGIPILLLFVPPDQVSHNYFSFFSPY